LIEQQAIGLNFCMNLLSSPEQETYMVRSVRTIGNPILERPGTIPFVPP
jgi:hypothetical protein